MSPIYVPGKLVLRKESVPFDYDAWQYIAAVEAEDGEILEQPVRDAITNFVIGCKTDGIWDAIKASCILAGARTLAGALYPLKGAAPTKQGTEGGWNYNRKTGLQGNGTNNYLNSNRLDSADPQDDSHRSVYIDTPGTQVLYDAYIGVVYTGPTRQSYILRALDAGGRMIFTERGGGLGAQADVANQQNATGFVGASRSASATHFARVAQANYSLTSTSQITIADNSYVFARNLNSTANSITNARLAFYSIGESLDLALLDARVTALVNAIGVAIP
ncbi:hypothetical protein CPKG_00051 [Cyanophage KBS-S-2A]|uniref:hypothetical protein n=1 Tax=Cyanophage KBS-S-2A TaxID=889953 RepID=UPI0002C186E5|nr:hypothetical protein CPKG_00051 [Cyanophage KBS-S-2A]AGH57682.1 hypothetical protein CPKG_00051 [Cyanophage KBS-S-2A]